MIPGLKPYPAMKDSAVPWVGDVPAHWETERAKWHFRKMDRPVRDVDEVVTCFRDGIVTLRKNRRVRGFTESLKEIGYQGIRRGDLVIHAMDAFAGAIGVADSDGKGTPVYSVCEPAPTANAHYYAYAVREMARSQWIQALAKGIRERSTDFRFDGFGSQPVPLPPLPEQAAIVRFLDHADRRIRCYIRAKQKLITLLEEQKQAIIHRAVTRGLDPNVRLKPSGVEWLGDVPEHWEVMRIKHVARMESGHTPSRGNPEHWLDQNDIPWVSLNDTKQLDRVDYISDTALHINALGLQNSSARILPAGIVVFTRDAAVGKAAITTRAMAVSQHVIAWVCGPRILNRYLLRVFYAMKAELSRFTFGATIATIGMDDVRKLVTPVPSLDEQQAIATHLEGACAHIAKSVACVQQELKLLHEHRTRLIADVVTGKLDVREAAARLPDEADESEALQDTDTLTEGDSDTDEADRNAVPNEAEA